MLHHDPTGRYRKRTQRHPPAVAGENMAPFHRQPRVPSAIQINETGGAAARHDRHGAQRLHLFGQVAPGVAVSPNDNRLHTGEYATPQGQL